MTASKKELTIDMSSEKGVQTIVGEKNFTDEKRQ